MGLPDRIRVLLEEGLAARLYSGAVAAVLTPFYGSTTVAVGTHAYGDEKPVTVESLFDLASVSKVVVATAIISLVEGGLIDPDEPVIEHLAVGSGPGAELITLRQLLTHTAGLPSDSFVWKDARMNEQQRMEAVLASPLQCQPDETFRYSCLGYIAAGKLAEAVSGMSLERLVTERVAVPLGLQAMTFGPVSVDRAVATEDESYVGRGMVRGEVHDELSWSLGGKVGNAGLFARASDLLTFAQLFLQDGRAGNSTVLHEEGLHLMTRSTLGAHHSAAFGHGMGLRIADRSFMGETNGMGHTGFTGTMMVIDEKRQTAAVLLTNRVHPNRDLVELNPLRLKFNTLIAAAAS